MPSHSSNRRSQHRSHGSRPPALSAKRTEDDRLTRLADAALILSLAAVPLSMAGQSSLRFLALAVTAALALFAVSLRALMRSDLSLRSTGFEWLLIAGTAVIAIQIVPLPAHWLHRLSPQLSELLPLWTGDKDPGELGRWTTLSMTPVATLRGLTSFIACWVLFFAVCNRIRRVEDANTCLRWVAVATIGIAALGLLQFFAGNGKFLWVYEHPESSPNFPVKGPFPSRNHFAGFLALGIAPVLWLLMRSSDADRHGAADDDFLSRLLGRRLPTFLWLGAGLIMLATLLSLSRGGLIALVVAAGVFTVIHWKKSGFSGRMMTGAFVCSGLVVAALLVYGFDRVEQRVTDVATGDLSRLDRNSARMEIWSANLRALRDFPILGAGVGSHRDVYPRYMETPRETEFQYAESTFLQIGTETGLAGLSLAVLGLLILLSRSAAAVAGGSSPSISAAQSAVLAGLVGGGMHACVDFTWYAPGCIVLVIFLAACGVRLWQLDRPDAPEPAAAPHGILRFAALMAGCGLSIWLIGTKLPAVAAEPALNRYLLLGRTSFRAEGGQTATYERLLALREASHADPLDPRIHLRLSNECLAYFRMLQASSDNAMYLPQLREAAAASDFSSKEQLRAWVEQVVGQNARLLDAADHHARRALTLSPWQSHGYLHLTQLAFLDRNASETTDALLDQARRVNSNDPLVLVASGEEAWLSGRMDEALGHWRAAWDRSEFSRVQLTNLLAGTVEPEFILNNFEPDWNALKLLKQRYESLDSPDGSDVIYRRYAEAAEKRADSRPAREASELWLTAAAVWKQMSELDRSRAALEKACELDGSSFSVRLALGTFLYEQADYAAASEHLIWCARRRPRDGRVRRMSEDAYRQQARRESVLPSPESLGRLRAQPNGAAPSVIQRVGLEVEASDNKSSPVKD